MTRAKSEIINEIKYDTNNYTDEVQGWHFPYNDAFEQDEVDYYLTVLKRHYKYVDYYTGDKGYYVYASNTINYDENPCDVNYKEGQ